MAEVHPLVDEDVAYLSPSTVYRILREGDLVCPWRRRSKRRREELEKARRPSRRTSIEARTSCTCGSEPVSIIW
jgi:hypothetical protein